MLTKLNNWVMFRFFFLYKDTLAIMLNPRPTKGVVTTPLTVCLRPHKNAKESDPGHLGHLFYILCGHFDEKKTGGTRKMGVGWAVKVRR